MIYHYMPAYLLSMMKSRIIENVESSHIILYQRLKFELWVGTKYADSRWSDIPIASDRDLHYKICN